LILSWSFLDTTISGTEVGGGGGGEGGGGGGDAIFFAAFDLIW